MEQWDNELIEALRRQNRVLRRTNRNLRSALQHSLEYNDHLFVELCNSYTDVEPVVEGTENQIY
jgi:hypothetical protein